MSLDFTVEGAIARLRRKLQLKDDNQKLTAAQILQIMDEEIQDRLFPMLCLCVEDYGVTWAPLTVRGGDIGVRLPSMCTSGTLMALRWVRPDTSQEVELPRVPMNRLPTQNLAINQGSAGPQRYALSGEMIIVSPQPIADTTLRALYQKRPSRLIASTECVAVQEMFVYGEITVAATPGPFVAYSGVDAVAGSPPLGIYETFLYISDIPNATTFVLSSVDPIMGTTPHTLAGFGALSAPGAPAIGKTNDWLCPTGYTNVFPLPDAWYSAWITSSAATAAAEMGNHEQAATLRSEADALLVGLQQHQSNRVRDQPLAVFNRQSGTRRMRYGANGGGYWGGS